MTFNDDDLKRLLTLIEPLYLDQIEALLARLEAAENRFDSLAHENDCILSLWCAGEPTPDGGYRSKYGEKWYQTKPVDESPKCNCGLDEKFNEWRKACGK